MKTTTSGTEDAFFIKEMLLKPTSYRKSELGFTMFDVLFGAIAIGIVAVASLESLVTLNRNAAVNRMYSNARAVVQNDADTALSDVWASSASPTPACMASGTSTVAIDSRDNPNNNWSAVTLVSGTLTRTVTPVLYQSGTTGVVTYQITSAVNYFYRGKTFNYQVTTMRSTDD